MDTRIRVRRAEAADAPALARLRWAFKQEERDEEGGKGEAESVDPARSRARAEEWMRERLLSGAWLAWVVEAGRAAEPARTSEPAPPVRTEAEVRGHVFLHLIERVPEPYEENSPLGYVTNFYVLPEHRNQGYGGALLRALRRHAAAAGAEVLIVWPAERSVPVYRRAGFGPSPDLLEAR